MLLNGGHIINLFLFDFWVLVLSKIGKMHLAMEIIKGQRCSQCRGLHHLSVLTKNSVYLRLSLEKSNGMGLVLNKPWVEQDLKEPSTT